MMGASHWYFLTVQTHLLNRLYQKPFLGSAMARVLADFMIMSND